MRQTTKERAQDKAEALDWLRANVNIGQTIYTCTRFYGSTGTRRVDVFIIMQRERTNQVTNARETVPELTRITGRVANACEFRYSYKHGEIVTTNDAFEVAYNISWALFGKGYQLDYAKI